MRGLATKGSLFYTISGRTAEQIDDDDEGGRLHHLLPFRTNGNNNKNNII